MHHEEPLLPEGAEAPATAPTNEELYREGQEHHTDHSSDGVQHELGDLVVPEPVANEAKPGEAPDATAPALEDGPSSSLEDADDADEASVSHSDETPVQAKRAGLAFLDQADDQSPQGVRPGLGFLSAEADDLPEQTNPADKDETETVPEPSSGENEVPSADAHDKAYDRLHGNASRQDQEAPQLSAEALEPTLSPYEELYEQAPEVFANMPTSQFMEVVKEYQQVRAQVAAAREALAVAEQARQTILDRYKQDGQDAVPEQPQGPEGQDEPPQE